MNFNAAEFKKFTDIILDSTLQLTFKKNYHSSLDWVAQLVRALSRYTRVVSSIPGQGTYKKQSMNA